jgi:hypothetical protein
MAAVGVDFPIHEVNRCSVETRDPVGPRAGLSKPWRIASENYDAKVNVVLASIVMVNLDVVVALEVEVGR